MNVARLKDSSFTLVCKMFGYFCVMLIFNTVYVYGAQCNIGLLSVLDVKQNIFWIPTFHCKSQVSKYRKKPIKKRLHQQLINWSLSMFLVSVPKRPIPKYHYESHYVRNLFEGSIYFTEHHLRGSNVVFNKVNMICTSCADKCHFCILSHVRMMM